MAERAGIHRVHALAWRELGDAEAGGSELFMSRVLATWAAAGLDVTLRTSAARGLAVHDRRDGYALIRRSGRFTVFPSAVLGELTRRHGPRPDAVVEAWNGVPFATPVWFRGPRLTVLHHVHGHMWDLVLPGPLAKAGWLLEHRLAPPLSRSTPVVTNSSSSRDEISGRLGLPVGNISVVPPGVDPHFTPAPGGNTLAGVPTILAVGRLMPHKHFDHLIRIAAEVRRNHPTLELVIAGEGYERPHLEAERSAVDGEAWIHLVGRVSDDELRAWYRRAWVLAATSIAEGFGMTITEAAACGTPAVATNIAGHRDALVDGSSGLLADTAADMATQLDAVLANPPLRARLATGALTRASELTWDAAGLACFAALAATQAGTAPQGRP